MQEHDPELSQAYQAAAHPEPPPALDARILTAARQAVTPAPRRRPAWFGWAVPLSSMAVLVLGISMLFRMQQEAPESLREAQTPLPASQPERTDMSPPAHQTPVSPQAARQRKQSLDSTSAAPPSLAPREREVPDADATMEMAAETASVATPPVPAMPTASSVRAAVQENRADAQPPVPAFSAGMSRMKSAAPVAAKAALPEESQEQSPEQWVAAIRQFLRQGNIDAARTRLEALRKRYPDFPLPPDLEPSRCCPESVPTP